MLLHDDEKKRYQEIKKRNDDARLYVSEYHLLKEPIRLEEIWKPRASYFKKRYWDNILEEKGVEKTIQLLVDRRRCEVVTGIFLPQLNKPQRFGTFGHVYRGDFSRGEAFCTNIPYFWKEMQETRFVSFPSDDDISTTDLMENYISTFCQDNNYEILKGTLMKGLDTCKFRKYYSSPPYLPDNMNVSEESEQSDISSDKEIKDNSVQLHEYHDGYNCNLEIILEVKQKISRLPLREQEKYLEQLNGWIETASASSEEIDIFNSDYQKQFSLRAQLCDLLADIEFNKKDSFNYGITQRYFDKFQALSEKALDSEKVEDKLSEFYTFTNYLEENKTQIDFSEYCILQEQISGILTNLLIFNSSIRDRIFDSLTSTYQHGIYQEINNRLNLILEQTADDDTSFSIYSMLIKPIDEDNFIKQGLSIIESSEENLRIALPCNKVKIQAKSISANGNNTL